MLKKMLKHEGTTFDESNGNATNIQQMCMVCGAENFTLPQALACGSTLIRRYPTHDYL